MTRANFEIICKDGKFYLQGNSSCYPSWTMGDVIKFATSTRSLNSIFDNKLGFYENPNSRDIAEFIENLGLTFGSVGNPSFYYQIDFLNKVVKVWESKTRWINAPLDWKAKGWKGCYEGTKGRFGYDTWVKGKCIYQKSFFDLIDTKANIVKQSEVEFAEKID